MDKAACDKTEASGDRRGGHGLVVTTLTVHCELREISSLTVRLFNNLIRPNQITVQHCTASRQQLPLHSNSRSRGSTVHCFTHNLPKKLFGLPAEQDVNSISCPMAYVPPNAAAGRGYWKETGKRQQKDQEGHRWLKLAEVGRWQRRTTRAQEA